MIDSPVLQLQDKAASVSVDLQELLLRGKMIAWKLNIKEAVEWFESELNGYVNNGLPDYRVLRNISIQGFDRAANTWSRIDILDCYDEDSLEYILCTTYETMKVKNSVSTLQRYADVQDENHYFDLPLNIVKDLKYFSSNSKYTRICRAVPAATFSAILTKIRTATLDWACLLEKEGVLGEGLQFTPTEKREAQHVTNQKIINYHGSGLAVLGDVDSKDGVVGGTVGNVSQQNVAGDFNALGRKLKDHGVDDADIKEL